MRYIERQMRGAIAETPLAEERIATFRGSTSGARRDEIKHAFNADPDKHPVRILLATDAAREGLNLQAHCSQLFHFDVPWSPSRMEQRNGRIDRKLQPAKRVLCSYFVYEQRPEDRILQAVVDKTRTIRKELGSLSQVIDSRLDDLLKHGIRRHDTLRLAGEIAAARLDPEHQEAIHTELESARDRQNDLRRSIEQLEGMMALSREELDFDEKHFRSAISYALELLHAPPLRAGASGEFLCRSSTICRARGLKPWTVSAPRANATRPSMAGGALLPSRPAAPRCDHSRCHGAAAAFADAWRGPARRCCS